ncbi:BA75_02276T0 [Komagataella pastoris]|uniref:Aminopeptidase n=1 Tax=Komagataella pastoris TaxID=4922 RepID=A0A1B2JAK8_PICPA|nr:BA75_02276T0 [Komagataella pastoris]
MHFLVSSFRPFRHTISSHTSVGHALSAIRVFHKNSHSRIQGFRHHSHYCCHRKIDMTTSTKFPERQLLPANVKPTKYDLTLEPLFSTFKFNGEETIYLDVQENSSSITLHALEIDLHDSLLITANKSKISPLHVTSNHDDQSLTFQFKEGTLVKGDKVQLQLKFIGELNDKMAGFYRSSYEENGETKYLATTQMEPTDCRRAFPSFDEPSLKAVFNIALIADQKLTCLSNMDVKEEQFLGNGRKKVIFNPTPLISTYLIAFIVGDLKYIAADYNYRIPVRVYATPGLENQGRFSVELAAKTLEFFEQQFDIDYPLPKMDMVAIHDFSAGAMENFGLVTYRVVDLLYDEKNSNLATKQRVAEVVQHELAHQWFGNLVTMEWWEGLWLNEGFATWMSWYSCDKFFPDWKVWEQYVTDSLQQALALDALRASHPIEVPVKRADEINQIFDAISYSKGSSLLKMISKWLGEDVFIKGVSNYLKKHKYGNTKTTDLWESLSEVSGKDVVKVMSIWTGKIGFPIISVNENGDRITFTQNRYLTTGDVTPEEDTTIYPVFLGLKTERSTDESLVLDSRSMSVNIQNSDFFKVNAEQAGIYRTNYSPERWIKLGKQPHLLSVEDRAGLVADAGALASSGHSSTRNFLNLVNSWKDESSFVVWDEITSRIASLKAAWLFEPKADIDALNAFVRDLISTKIKQIGWSFTDNEPFLEQRLKSLLYATAAGAKEPEVVKSALVNFQEYVAGDKTAIHPNIKAVTFQTVAAQGSEKEWDQLFDIYKNPVSIDEKIIALRSLGRFEDPILIAKTLALLFDGSVRSQDIYIPMQGLRATKVGVESLFQWLTLNWDRIYKLLPPGLSMLGSVVTISTSGFTSLNDQKRVKDFFASKNTKGFDQGLAQALDTIQSKASWVQRDSKNVSDWLYEQGYKS